ncbi:MAG: hypothetical protein WBP13_12515 [Methylophilaceae bacterium]
MDNIDLKFEADHVKTLQQLLNTIDEAPHGETPSELEKRVSKAKILPKSNLASRTWVLRILAEIGVIRNRVVPDYSGALHFYDFTKRDAWEQQMHDQSPVRADPVWPLSVWRGGDGVNWEIAKSLFPQMSIFA